MRRKESVMRFTPLPARAYEVRASCESLPSSVAAMPPVSSGAASLPAQEVLCITLHLTRKQAYDLHDLVTDADMHGGKTLYPVPLVEGMADAVCGPVLNAIDALDLAQESLTHA